MLCREEERDPRKCIAEGTEVTGCGIRFFQQVKKNCRDIFDEFTDCIDHRSRMLHFYPCKKLRQQFDDCMETNMGLRRPAFGHFMKPFVHDTQRPKPVHQHRDYEAEAAQLMPSLPEGRVPDDYRHYYGKEAGWDWGLL